MPSPDGAGEGERMVEAHQLKSPESSGTSVVPIRATPPPAMSCIIPN